MSVTNLDVRRFKGSATPFAMLTAYDYPTAKALDEAGVPVILVGDTLGIFVLGYTTTIPVTLDDVLHHCKAVSRAATNALIVGDLPFGSYQISVEQGIQSAGRLIKEGGAHAVKLEGPEFQLVERLASSGIPVMGHLGLTPQSFFQFGGNKVQSRTQAALTTLVRNARGLESAGVFAIVLEAVPSEAARQVTEALSIPTIGIGAGPHCDGQVLVSTEMLGLSSGPRPRYAKVYAGLHDEIVRAAQSFVAEVASRVYPDSSHSYDWSIRT